ncbi:hypothetical protein Tco_0063723, partial [Tanacetum coccineum]
LVPLDVNRVTFFEMYCRSLDITPTLPLFRIFYKLCKQGNWFSFQNRARKNCKPCLKDAPTSLKKWKDKIFLVDRRAAPIAMAWWHHDSSVAVPFPGPREYNTSNVAKLREVVISLRRPPLSVLYVLSLWPSFCDSLILKVLDDKEKKKKKAEEKAAAKVPVVNIEAEMVVNKDAGREGPRKKRRVLVGPQVHPDSEHVSSPTLNHAIPLEALVNEEHVYPPLSVGRMDTLRDQTD